MPRPPGAAANLIRHRISCLSYVLWIESPNSPWPANLDSSGLGQTWLWEAGDESGYSVQFRAEVFNLPNSFFNTRLQFNNNPESPNFGTLIKAAVSAPESNYPRQVQLALKLIW